MKQDTKVRNYYYQVIWKGRYIKGIYYSKATSSKSAEIDCLVNTTATDIDYTLSIDKHSYDTRPIN